MGRIVRRVRPAPRLQADFQYRAFVIFTCKATGLALHFLALRPIGVIWKIRGRRRIRVFGANYLEKSLPADQEVHLIMDNYCTHKSAAVQRWLKPKKRRRFHFHFTPTSSSWLNQVERFLALITGRMIRRGTFHSTGELEKAIYQWLAHWNGGTPKPFIWKASADVILDKVRRCKELTRTGD